MFDDVVQADSVVGLGTPSIDAQNDGSLGTVLWKGGQVNGTNQPAVITSANQPSLLLLNAPFSNLGNTPFNYISGNQIVTSGIIAAQGTGRIETYLLDAERTEFGGDERRIGADGHAQLLDAVDRCGWKLFAVEPEREHHDFQRHADGDGDAAGDSSRSCGVGRLSQRLRSECAAGRMHDGRDSSRDELCGHIQLHVRAASACGIGGNFDSRAERRIGASVAAGEQRQHDDVFAIVERQPQRDDSGFERHDSDDGLHQHGVRQCNTRERRDRLELDDLPKQFQHREQRDSGQ